MVTPAQGELEYEVMLDAKVNLTDGTAWDSMGQLRSDMVGLKRIENGLKTIELVEHLHTQPIIGRVKTSKLLDLGVSIRPLTRCDFSRCLAELSCHVMSCIYIYILVPGILRPPWPSGSWVDGTCRGTGNASTSS